MLLSAALQTLGHAFPRVQSSIPTPASVHTKCQPGNVHPPGEGGNQRRRSSDTAKCFLLSFFLIPKKEGGFQDVTPQLVHNHRFKGRTFSHSNSTTSQTVPALCTRRAYQFRVLPFGLSHGNANPPILGQLADLCSTTGTSRARQPFYAM